VLSIIYLLTFFDISIHSIIATIKNIMYFSIFNIFYIDYQHGYNVIFYKEIIIYKFIAKINIIELESYNELLNFISVAQGIRKGVII
jgi:hypothetical protein